MSDRRHLFEPRLVNDRFGDPALFVDLGDVSRLPPRLMLRISHVFVSHTHMDHFAGFDGLLRVVLGRKQRLVLTGGPDFVAQTEHRLRSYSWNVVHRYAVPLCLEVREIGLAGAGRRACFVDHEMPCLAFALEEKPRARVDRARLARLGLSTGAWLRELRAAVARGAAGDTPIALRWRDAGGEHAARKNHLTAAQAGGIARELGARRVEPFHFSPRYGGREAELAQDLKVAWTGAA